MTSPPRSPGLVKGSKLHVTHHLLPPSHMSLPYNTSPKTLNQLD